MRCDAILCAREDKGRHPLASRLRFQGTCRPPRDGTGPGYCRLPVRSGVRADGHTSFLSTIILPCAVQQLCCSQLASSAGWAPDAEPEMPPRPRPPARPDSVERDRSGHRSPVTTIQLGCLLWRVETGSLLVHLSTPKLLYPPLGRSQPSV